MRAVGVFIGLGFVAMMVVAGGCSSKGMGGGGGAGGSTSTGAGGATAGAGSGGGSAGASSGAGGSASGGGAGASAGATGAAGAAGATGTSPDAGTDAPREAGAEGGHPPGSVEECGLCDTDGECKAGFVCGRVDRTTAWGSCVKESQQFSRCCLSFLGSPVTCYTIDAANSDLRRCPSSAPTVGGECLKQSNCLYETSADHMLIGQKACDCVSSKWVCEECSAPPPTPLSACSRENWFCGYDAQQCQCLAKKWRCTGCPKAQPATGATCDVEISSDLCSYSGAKTAECSCDDIVDPPSWDCGP